jgi:hypothetical protein
MQRSTCLWFVVLFFRCRGWWTSPVEDLRFVGAAYSTAVCKYASVDCTYKYTRNIAPHTVLSLDSAYLTARMELKGNALEILIGKAIGKRPLGGPRRRWVHDVWRWLYSVLLLFHMRLHRVFVPAALIINETVNEYAGNLVWTSCI